MWLSSLKLLTLDSKSRFLSCSLIAWPCQLVLNPHRYLWVPWVHLVSSCVIFHVSLIWNVSSFTPPSWHLPCMYVTCIQVTCTRVVNLSHLSALCLNVTLIDPSSDPQKKRKKKKNSKTCQSLWWLFDLFVYSRHLLQFMSIDLFMCLLSSFSVVSPCAPRQCRAHHVCSHPCSVPSMECALGYCCVRRWKNVEANFMASPCHELFI